ncbi:thiamine-phosphate kinase [Rhodococcus sp. 06-156-4C]|nr:thiamine-phosphate kinase [Rhodococcus sp. 06-156-4C]OZD05823.1 thiamine-phosphate kinase [Rhodococcus sp. 06-156-4C]
MNHIACCPAGACRPVLDAHRSVRRYRSVEPCSAQTEKRKTIGSRTEPGAPGSTVADVGEFGVIDRITSGWTQSSYTVLGPGDDAAIVTASDGRVVAATDMLVEGRHFRLDWSSPEHVGRKAIAQNAADIAAMGARCTGFLVALGCPSDTDVAVLDGLYRGLWGEAQRAGASIIGGDLVRTNDVVISITALGDLEGRSAVLRSGASVGDVVDDADDLGRSAAGLDVIRAGISGHDGLVSSHRVPSPDYEQGRTAALAGATSLTDISDGLVADLGHVAVASSVTMDLDAHAFDIGADLRSAAQELGASALAWVLGGGEDHAFAATFSDAATVPAGWTVIGRVGAARSDGSATQRVTVDGVPFAGTAGWSSFGA